MSLYTILAVGRPPVEVLKRLSHSLSRALAAEVRLSKIPVDPEFAYIPERNQYHSTKILEALNKTYSEFRGRVLGVTEVDICIPILTHVFGEAQLNGRTALISIHRLYQKYYGLSDDEDLFNERVYKEAMHEIGHTLGLHHCENWNCVMHTSNVVEEIDIKGSDFCPECRKNLL